MAASGESAVYDIVIVGGGLAGGALALALSRAVDGALRIALVEGQRGDSEWPPDNESVLDYDARVSAITEASQQFLASLGVWSEISAQRSCAYSDMEVWDGEGTGRIHFSAAEVNRQSLGHIVENRLINVALRRALDSARNVDCLFGASAEKIHNAVGGASLFLQDGRELRGDLLVAADGANSRLRGWAGLSTREWDYHHHAIVATVETALPHRDAARQVFLPSGPLAFLPLPDRNGAQCFSSIVWSLLPERAEALMAMDEAAFCAALGQAFEQRAGDIVACSRRFSFPLRQRHAVDYYRESLVLVGDAAHSIHPLAGQGINLGFADVKALAEELARARQKGLALNDSAVLSRYQRRRKGDNLAMMALMEGFQHLFETPFLPLRLLRNSGMSWLDKTPLIKRQLVAAALGSRAL